MPGFGFPVFSIQECFFTNNSKVLLRNVPPVEYGMIIPWLSPCSESIGSLTIILENHPCYENVITGFGTLGEDIESYYYLNYSSNLICASKPSCFERAAHQNCIIEPGMPLSFTSSVHFVSSSLTSTSLDAILSHKLSEEGE